MSADSRESVQRRITATRVLLLGALGFFAKKEQVVSYLVVEDSVGEWIFAVPQMSSMHLHAWSRPARARVVRHEAPVALLAPPEPPQARMAAGRGADEIAARLERLDALLERAVITRDEYAARRTTILEEP